MNAAHAIKDYDFTQLEIALSDAAKRDAENVPVTVRELTTCERHVTDGGKRTPGQFLAAMRAAVAEVETELAFARMNQEIKNFRNRGIRALERELRMARKEYVAARAEVAEVLRGRGVFALR